MDKATIIIHHYGSGKADFEIGVDGKIKWEGPGEPPTDAQINQWWGEYQEHIGRTETNKLARDFLADSDWKVTRHIRQKTLGIETSMSEEEYTVFETERQEKAESIIDSTISE